MKDQAHTKLHLSALSDTLKHAYPRNKWLTQKNLNEIKDLHALSNTARKEKVVQNEALAKGYASEC
ncbi:MAG TPA: hypothetical protein H9903_01590 [Candidatus Aquabacterium excrementipullorum]|nr:hypothetical protein [Candidatus Aquabacterium excrementipullorum]